MTLEEVLDVLIRSERAGKNVVRLHTGDPCLYGAIREQMDALKKEHISYEICPGVSSFCGAAAVLEAEYTLPGVSQSVVITRMAGRTPVPEKESIRSFAAHQATMVLFLSTGLLGKLQEELKAGGYAPETPAAIVYKATWPDEKVCRCTVSTLEQTAKANRITKTALIVVGNVLGDQYDRSEPVSYTHLDVYKRQDLFTYCVTSVQLALAYPSESGGIAASAVKFLGVFAPTQLPLAVIEGILTVVIVIALESYARPELKAVGFLKEV